MHVRPFESLGRASLAAAFLFTAGTAGAADSATPEKTRFGVSLNATILTGFGLSVGIPLGPKFNARFTGNTFSMSRDFDQDDAAYTGKVKLLTLGLLGDWQPFEGAFRVTAGLVNNGNKITLDGVANDNGRFGVGDCEYQSDPSDPLRVHGEVTWDSLAPYLGIGWGGNMSAAPGFYGTFDIGVIFSGSATADLTGRGKATNANPAQTECGTGSIDAGSNPQFQQQLETAERDANDDIGSIELWPAIGFGLGWRF